MDVTGYVERMVRAATQEVPLGRVHAVVQETIKEVLRKLNLEPSETSVFPSYSLLEYPDSVQVFLDVPGLTEQMIDVVVQPLSLTVRGERPREGGTTVSDERFSGPFHRAIALPFEVVPDRTKATLKDGVLCLSLARKGMEAGQGTSVHIERT